MKKLSYLLIILVLISFISGCTTQKAVGPVEQTQAIRVASLKGPTSIGLVKLMDQNGKGESNNKYDFTMAATADEIVAAIGKGDMDIAAIPANLASVLYNKTEGKISVIAINTLGVLYIVENGENLASIENLKGNCKK